MKLHEYKKTIKRISNNYKKEDDNNENYVQEIENKDDIIELDKTEYAQVINGCTSLLSMSDYDPSSSNRFNDEDDYAPIPKENNSIFESLKSKIFNMTPVEKNTASNIYGGLRYACFISDLFNILILNPFYLSK